MSLVAEHELIFRCDGTLTVQGVDGDDAGRWGHAVGKALATLVDPDSLPAFFDLRMALNGGKAYFRVPLALVDHASEPFETTVFCVRRDAGYDLIAFDAPPAELSIDRDAGQELHFHLDEMSKLNNEVINAKREVMQAKAEITRLLEGQQTLNRQLEETIAMKDRLFSLLGHDLRSPIASMMDLVSLLELGETTYLEVLEMGLISNMRQMGERTLNLLSDLTLWYRSTQENGVIRKNPVPVKLLIDRIHESLRQHLISEKIHLTTDCHPDLYAHADERVVETILRNLLSNAVKFTPAGGSIDVRAKMNGQKIELRVADSGVGMTEERLSNLFHLSGETGTKGVRGEKGLGLGLVLSKELLEEVGGSIEASSVLGEGSVFTVCLPALALA